MPRIVNFIDYDLEMLRAGKSTGSLKHSFGFDDNAKFLRVGEQSRKQFSTLDGPPTGLTFDVRPAGICTILNQDMTLKGPTGRQGLVTLEAKASGTCKLALVNGSGKAIDEISITVVPQRNVKVRFYNLVDAKGRQGIPASRISTSEAGLEALIDRVNEIVGLQCDVWMRKTGQGLLRDLRTLKDLGPKIDINKFNIFGEPDQDADAEYHVLFVWAIDGAHSNGITLSNVTMLDASLPLEKREVTLAHEFVHFLSGSGIVAVGDHDSDRSDLLFRIAPHGLMLRKSRLLKIIPHP